MAEESSLTIVLRHALGAAKPLGGETKQGSPSIQSRYCRNEKGSKDGPH